jgi:hypothetical protein
LAGGGGGGSSKTLLDLDCRLQRLVLADLVAEDQERAGQSPTGTAGNGSANSGGGGGGAWVLLMAAEALVLLVAGGSGVVALKILAADYSGVQQQEVQ